MKTFCLIMLSLLAAPPAVEVQQLDGSKTEGNLVQMTADSLSLELADGSSSTLSTKDIINVVPTSPAPFEPQSPPAFEVSLADGSQLLIANLNISSRTADLKSPGGNKISLGKSAMKGIRFLHPEADASLADDDPLKQRWYEIVSEYTGADAIVLIREGDLTIQEVVIHGVSSKGVKIQLDDLTTTVDLSKLYGLLFYQRGARTFPSPLCLVELNDRSKLLARSVQLNNGHTQVTTLTGTEIPVAFDQITKLDFAAGNIQFLDEMKPARVTWTPVLQSGIAIDDFALVYAPKMNTSFRGTMLTLEEDGEPVAYSRGMAVHATSELLYDLPTGFRQLQMRVGIAPASLGSCTAKLQIVGDQKILFEKEFSGDTQPEDIALNISGVRRMKIIVDAADGEDWGDVLHLCQARLIK
ncbi:NPCBM/NEW2 domain-containing protein [Bremerella cremea]|uniref:NPCBM/NEW2 domain-containing protein n=1 Tax=Bremerella cremea TaxID=1031537 RepID=UPI0031F0D3BD